MRPLLVLLLVFCYALPSASGSIVTLNASASSGGSLDDEVASSSLEWGKCAFSGSLGDEGDAECAMLRVPVCYNGACGKAATDKVKLAVLRRLVDESAPTLWTLFTTTDISGVAQINRLEQMRNVNVYALQSRGAVISVGATEDDDSPPAKPCLSLIDSIPPHRIDTELASKLLICRQWMDNAFGVNGANAFSLDSSAKDLALAMSLVGRSTPSSPMYIYAAGEMTRTLQRFMVQTQGDKSSANITGYIFDHPVPMRRSIHHDKYDGNAFDRFFAACTNGTNCYDNYQSIGLTMGQVLQQMLTTLDETPETASSCLTKLRSLAMDSIVESKPSRAVRRLLSSYTRESRAQAKALAPILFRIHRCDKEDLSITEEIRPSSVQWDDRGKTFVDTLIEYSELWPSDIPSQNELFNTYETTRISHGNMIYGLPSYCAYTASNSANCLPFYKGYSRQPNASLALVYPSNKSVDTTAATSGFVGSSTADVLVLTSRLSTLSTQDEALQLYEAFSPRSSGDRSTMLVVSDNLQGSEFTGEFAAVISNIVEMFVSKRTSRWNGKWYVTDLKPPVSAPVSTYETTPVSVSFTMTTDDRKVWFGGHDAYESGSSRYGYTTPTSDRGDCDDSDTNLYIWGGVIMGGFLIIAIWMGYMRMRQRRRHEELAREEAVRVQVQQDQFNRMYAVLQQSAALQASAPRPTPPEAPHNGIYGYSSYVHQPQSYSAPHSHAQGYDRQQYDYRRGY